MKNITNPKKDEGRTDFQFSPKTTNRVDWELKPYRDYKFKISGKVIMVEPNYVGNDDQLLILFPFIDSCGTIHLQIDPSSNGLSISDEELNLLIDFLLDNILIPGTEWSLLTQWQVVDTLQLLEEAE